MDNLIQLIVFGIIIYSILAPILSKKKPQQGNKSLPNNRPGDVQNRTSPRSSADMLEELFGLKLPKTEDQYPVESKQRYDSQYEPVPRVDYDTDLKIKYSNLETETKMVEVDYDKIPFDSKMPEIYLLKKEYSAYDSSINISKRTKDLKQKLKNSSTMRELFLTSEIINKPKALRR